MSAEAIRRADEWGGLQSMLMPFPVSWPFWCLPVTAVRRTLKLTRVVCVGGTALLLALFRLIALIALLGFSSF